MKPSKRVIHIILIKAFWVVFFLGSSSDFFAQDFNFNYAKSFGGYASEYVYDMSVDNYGNVALMGDFYGSVDFDPGPDQNIKESIGSTDIFVAKFDSIGQLLWVHTFGSYNFENPGELDFDNNGNVIFSGTFNSPIDVDPSAAVYTLSNAGTSNGGGTGIPSQQGFVVKLDPQGNFVWVNYAPSYFGTSCQKLEVTNNNEILFTKIFLSGSCCSGTTQHTLNKLSSTGQFIWSQTIGPYSLGYGGDLSLYQLEVSEQNEILVCGNFRNNNASSQSTLIFQSSNATFTAAGTSGQFVLKLDSEGELILGQYYTSNNFLSAGIESNGDF